MSKHGHCVNVFSDLFVDLSDCHVKIHGLGETRSIP